MRRGSRTLVIFGTAHSSYADWRPPGVNVETFRPETHWGPTEAAMWVTAQWQLGEARVLLLPIQAASGAVQRALAHLPMIVGREVELVLTKVSRGDAGPVDGALAAGWEGLTLPELPVLTLKSADVETVLGASSARTANAPTAEAVSADTAALLKAFSTPAPDLTPEPKPSTEPAGTPGSAEPVKQETDPAQDWSKLAKPRSGVVAAISLAALEREASQKGLKWDLAAYLRWAAPTLWPDLPHSTWLELLTQHAPRDQYDTKSKLSGGSDSEDDDILDIGDE